MFRKFVVVYVNIKSIFWLYLKKKYFNLNKLCKNTPKWVYGIPFLFPHCASMDSDFHLTWKKKNCLQKYLTCTNCPWNNKDSLFEVIKYEPYLTMERWILLIYIFLCWLLVSKIKCVSVSFAIYWICLKSITYFFVFNATFVLWWPMKASCLSIITCPLRRVHGLLEILIQMFKKRVQLQGVRSVSIRYRKVMVLYYRVSFKLFVSFFKISSNTSKN